MAYKILFVDDEEKILASLKRLFIDEDYEIFAVSSGHEALELIKEETVDLIVSDHRMPEMEGVELLKRSKEYLPDAIRMLFTGYADMNVAIDAINEGGVSRYITKPWNDDELKATIHDALELRRLTKENKNMLELTRKQNLELKDLNANLEEKVEAKTNELRGMYDELTGAYGRLEKGFMESVKVFANLVRLRKRSIALHHTNTAVMSKMIAQNMKLSDDNIKDIEVAALLHDIGKIGMDDYILNKAFDDMNDAEKMVFMKHPILGQVSLQSIETMQKVDIIIRHHHERWDGGGYPDGLKGEQIPVGSRIISIASDYDALMNGTLVSSKLSSCNAKHFIIRNIEKRYDPNIVQLSIGAFIKQEKEVENRREVKIVSSALKDGMVITRDIYIAGGFLLVSRNMKLTTRLIENIVNFEKAENKKYDIYILPLKREIR
ncbi:MAG: HD domain-containing phosphohydrolase [Candidatus Anammoxibacter sp.]